MSLPAPETSNPAPWRNALIVFLAVLVATLSGIVVWQQAEIRRLAGGVTARTSVTVHAATSRGFAIAGRRADQAADDASQAGERAGESGPRGILRAEEPRPAPAGGLARLLDNPEFFQLLGLHRQAAIDARFAGLFRQLRLGARELTEFRRLLADKENVALDVVAVSEARAEGPLSDDALLSSVSAARAQVEAAIRESLGGERYALYREYERTLPHRTIVAQLEQRLSYSPTPLTAGQADALVRILVLHTAPSPSPALPAAAGVVVGKSVPAVAPLLQPEVGAVRLTENAIVESQAVLTPAQVNALRDIQGEQVATARAMQLLRDNLPASARGMGSALQALLQ